MDWTFSRKVDFHVLSGQMIAIIFSLTLLAGFSLAAYFLDYPRLYIYGLLLGIAPFVGEWFLPLTIAFSLATV